MPASTFQNWITGGGSRESYKYAVTSVTLLPTYTKPSISAASGGFSEVTVGEEPPVTSVTLLDLFEERAAIMEFDAGLPRAEAERLAWLDVGKFRRT